MNDVPATQSSRSANRRRLSSVLRRWMWYLFLRPRSSTIKRIEARKAERKMERQRYVDHPRVSIIVQSFNQVRNIDLLEAGIRRTCAEELIVCEDGSIDGSHQKWLGHLTGPNDFLLHSNDIHEIRSYSRAIGYARGEIICLMQDDDRPPADGRWLEQAARLFDVHPDLAVLGGWCGFNDYFNEEYNAPWLPPGVGAIPSVDPHLGVPLIFVENVNIGPYLLRRQTYEELGGFDLRFSPPGEPGITFEAELCYRAWLHGYRVGLTDIPVKRESGAQSYILPGGTSLWGNEERTRNELTNKDLIQQIYDHHLPFVQAAVNAANSDLSRQII